jgi:hypothetical protein
MTEQLLSKRKRDLLPLWIKIFLWLFLVMASFMPVVIFLVILKFPTSLYLYGFESNSAFSVVGFIITCLITYKGIIAFGLWNEKKWAVTNAIIDGILGIIACVLAMILPLFLYDGVHFTFRLELIGLFPYLFKMREIRNEWNDVLQIVVEKSEDEKMEEEPTEKVTIYTTHTYTCEDGTLTIEQEFQNPNIGEKVFINDKPASFGKYKLGFMSHIFVNDGVIENITNF